MINGRPASTERPRATEPDLICFSHLRWNFVFQRPQHLLSLAAGSRRVFYVEEPVWSEGASRVEARTTPEGVHVLTPHLPHGVTGGGAESAQRELIDALLAEHGVDGFVAWYYTPMALAFTRHLRPRAIVYDVMDELSLFRFAPPELLEREAELFRRADVVFTGGRSLYEAKRHRHPNVHLFPSSVDVRHFATAREAMPDPRDQAGIPHPRLGFFGVIDERMDLALLAELADASADWHLVLLGPVVKIDPADLPRRPNVHYLGPKEYAELPRYAGGWDVALMPWARNEATRFISPTKTPEYLAAGLPVVSTPVTDVVRPYGEAGLVRIAAEGSEFVREIRAALEEDASRRADRQRRVDAFLATTSWKLTWDRMQREIAAVSRADLAGGPADVEAFPASAPLHRERRSHV
jgi:glycosyltransferase involved in cell wall biosynthesis